MADYGCNTATESFQTNCLHRVFHSCYFRYVVIITLVNTKIVATKLGSDFEVSGGAESEYGVSFVGLALVFELLPPPVYKIPKFWISELYLINHFRNFFCTENL